MKTFVYLLSVACLGFLSASCVEIDHGGQVSPYDGVISVTLPDNPTLSAYPGDEVKYKIGVSYEPGIASVAVQLNGKELEGSKKDFAGAASGEYELTYAVQSADAGNNLNFEIGITGSDGNTRQVDYPLYVLAAKANITITIPYNAPSGIEIGAGDVSFDVEIYSEQPLRQIRLLKNGAEVGGSLKTEFDDPNNYVYAFFYTPSALDVGTDVLFRFEVMDATGGIVTQDYTIRVERSSVPSDIDEFSSFDIGYQFNTSYGPFLEASTGDIYTIAGSGANSAKIDIMCYYSGSGANTGMGLLSPSASNMESLLNATNVTRMEGDPITDIAGAWLVRNETRLKKLTAMTPLEYAELLTAAQIETACGDMDSEAVLVVNVLQPNNMIAFRTAAGKYGVIRVVQNAAGNTNSVKIAYKVQK